MGRPRKLGHRTSSGRLKRRIKEDARLPTALTRIRDFGVTVSQSTNPLAGYLAGVLYLRRRITADHLGRFYSFLEISPVWVRGIEYRERVQTNNFDRASTMMNARYNRLARELGRSIVYLHELACDRLVCPVNTLKRTLDKVPLTRAGFNFSISSETHRPNGRSSKHRRPAMSSSKHGKRKAKTESRRHQ